MIAQSDLDTLNLWREHGIPDHASTRDYAARIVVKLLDERDEWRGLALELVDHLDCGHKDGLQQQLLDLGGAA